MKLRGILEKEQSEDAFTPQEYMNLYTCVPRGLPRLRSTSERRRVHSKNATFSLPLLLPRRSTDD